MKILYIAKTIIPSKAANSLHLMKMCQAFSKNGHDTVLMVLDESKKNIRTEEDVYDFYAVNKIFQISRVKVPNPRGKRIRYAIFTILNMLRVIPLILYHRPKIVYGRDLPSCFIAAFIGKTTVYESHFPIWKSSLESFLFKLFLKLPRFKRIIVISDALKEVYLQKYGEQIRDKIYVAHDASDPALPVHGKNLGEKLNVGYVGHLYEGKGVEVIQGVAPLLSDVDFHIIGGLEDDINIWKSRILEKNVIFHGFVEQGNLSAYINGLDICLLPNQKTVLGYGANLKHRKNIASFTSPLKMFEYMAHKKPIIASDLPVLREVLNTDIACLVPPLDFLAWKEAINSLRDSKDRELMATRAYTVFLEKYTWSQRAKLVVKGIS